MRTVQGLAATILQRYCAGRPEDGPGPARLGRALRAVCGGLITAQKGHAPRGSLLFVAAEAFALSTSRRVPGFVTGWRRRTSVEPLTVGFPRRSIGRLAHRSAVHRRQRHRRVAFFAAASAWSSRRRWRQLSAPSRPTPSGRRWRDIEPDLVSYALPALRRSTGAGRAVARRQPSAVSPRYASKSTLTHALVGWDWHVRT